MTTFNTETITEHEAVGVYHELANRFGWAGTFFTRDDAEERWLQESGEDTFSDDNWNDLTSTWYWRKGIENRLCEEGWDVVDLAIDDALKAKAEREGNQI
jgi:hypothetical protein